MNALTAVFASLALASQAIPADRLFDADGRVMKDDFFPIAVWLQSPHNAARYKAAGINLYVGLWNGPTEAQLADLAKSGMPAICDRNEVALKHAADPLIAGWMHGDEPDNAQELPGGKGYGPPILPEKILADYRRLRAADPTRPVLLNLGQGVAWDDYIGRGVRRRHPEDYREYVKGCQIASFDIYPVNHDSPEVRGKLEYVPAGVQRLRGWAGNDRTVWNCIECTGIGRPDGRPTPAQVRSEVWMSLIAGSRGIIYFVHRFKPTFREAALLDDPEMLAAVAEINRQLKELAPVLNSPSISEGATVTASDANAKLATMLKRRGREAWLFVANLQASPVRAELAVTGAKDDHAGVLGEARKIDAPHGRWSDDFPAYGVHIYRLSVEKK